jgi:diguanylate cyclase (GGDEF)-like protein/PAS domain S-box-containing protein
MKHGIPIRAGLGLLVLATALPFVSLIAYNTYFLAQTEAAQAGAEALRAARAAAAEAQDTLRRAQLLLAVLSTRPAVRSLDPAHCAPIFGGFGELYPEYTNLLTARRNGERVCSAVPPAPGAPAKVDPGLYLSETLRSRAFTLAPAIRGVFSGRWIAIAAHPIAGERGEISGVVAVAIDLAKLQLAPREAGLPPQAVASIVDAAGTVIGSSVDPDKWIGQNFKDVPWFKLLEPGRAKTGRAADVDGNERIYGIAPIDGTNWYAAVGVPVALVYGPIWRRLSLNAAVSVIALVLAAALGYLIARRIAGPVETIAAAARRATHSPSSRELSHATVSFAPKEIRMLAGDFGAMLKARSDAEMELRESEAGLRRAQLMAQLAHVVTGEDGSFESWSETFPQLIGGGSAALPKGTREWLALLHPEDRQLFRSTSIEAAVKGARGYVEYRLHRPDGEWIHVRQMMEPMPAREPEGATRWFSTLQNITAQKRAAQAMRRSEEELQRFRLALNNSADMVLIIDRARMRFLDVNETACKLLGYTREELLRMGPQDILPVNRQDLEKAYDELIKNQSSPSGMRSYYRCRDGSRLPFESTRHVFRSGDAWLVAAISRDIRERIASEQALRESEAGLKRLNRVYAVLSGINALIVRVRDRGELFREACRIAVEAGKLRFVWIGVVDADAMQLRPVAWDGHEQDFFAAVQTRLSLGESDAQGRAMVVRAALAKETMVSNDVANDPRIMFKQEHAERGIRSLAAFPLIVSDRVAGVLALHAAEVGFFDDDELRLLTELAGDISFALEHIEKSERADYLAYHDSLTGLPNRTLFHEHLEQFLHTADREQHKLALLVLDIERFKSINDTLGRHAGDALLKQVAERMVRSRGDPTRIARLSADHFALVLPRVRTDAELARRIESRFQEFFGLPYGVGDTELRISAKIGIALYPSDAADAETLFKNAEAALKKAKQTGERYLFYAEQMTKHVAEKLTLENKLRQALEKDELVLHYQSKVDLETKRIVGMEALIRWNSREFGLVPPMKFVPLMEETGLILEAGAWAMRRAVQDHLEWQRLGFGALRVAVNVSPIQLRMRDFVSVVEEALKDGAAPPGIDLEITESLIMEDIQGNIEKLKAIRNLGLSIAVDDFGTGYSSLAYLAKLPVETLKIDRSFINTMLNDPDTATLVETIISLAHSLRLKVVAEGVETEEQAKVLRLLQCDQMQGYLFSKPLPLEQMTALLRAQG